MKGGAENRKKTLALGVLGAVALCGVLYNVFSLFGGESTPPPVVAPVSTAATPARGTTTDRAARTDASLPGTPGVGAGVPGVAAQKLIASAASLDPTLDQAAMLRTESLVYSGAGRNIFSATSTAPLPLTLPRNVPSARPSAQRLPVVPTYQGPPPPPAIPLKFFGTAQRGGNSKQALLLSGDDVYLASPGDIVAKRFRVGPIMPFGVTITDLGSNNTQTIPLQQQP